MKEESEDISVHLMSSFWPGDIHLSNWGEGTCGTQFQKDFPLTVPRASRLTMTPPVVHALSTTKPILPTHQTSTPCPSTGKTLSNIPSPVLLSPLSILSDPGDGERSATGLCFQVSQLLAEPPFWLGLYWRPFLSGSAIQNSAWPLFEQGSQCSVVEKSEGIYI